MLDRATKELKRCLDLINRQLVGGPVKKIINFGLVCLMLPLIGASNPSKYEITVLATNIANFGGFGEWSFGALYEGANETVMFDTGFHEDPVMHYAKRLG